MVKTYECLYERTATKEEAERKLRERKLDIRAQEVEAKIAKDADDRKHRELKLRLQEREMAERHANNEAERKMREQQFAMQQEQWRVNMRILEERQQEIKERRRAIEQGNDSA